MEVRSVVSRSRCALGNKYKSAESIWQRAIAVRKPVAVICRSCHDVARSPRLLKCLCFLCKITYRPVPCTYVELIGFTNCAFNVHAGLLVYLLVCLSTCLLPCLPSCLSASLLVCLPACWSACLLVCLPARLILAKLCLFACSHPNLPSHCV